MKTVSIALAIAVLTITACKKDKDKQTSQKQLLIKIRDSISPAVNTEIDYVGDKVSEVRDLKNSGFLVTYRSFSYDLKNRAVGYFSQTPNPATNTTLFLQHSLFYGSSILEGVKITRNINGGVEVVKQYFLDQDDGAIIASESNATVHLGDVTGRYNAAGNLVQLIKRTPPTAKPDTTEFVYDDHPNPIAPIDHIKGENFFLPPSTNNVVTATLKRGGIPPKTTQFTYEYNAAGNPVKIRSGNSILLLEYKQQ